MVIVLLSCSAVGCSGPRKAVVTEEDVLVTAEKYVRHQLGVTNALSVQARFIDDRWIAEVAESPPAFGRSVILEISTSGEVLGQIPGM